VTLNPAVDEAVAVERLVLGATNRCALDDLDPGGKGINVSRVLRRLGRPTLALGFIGGVTGEFVREGLDREGVLHAFDRVDGVTRINVMLLERSSNQRTRMYLPGAAVGVERLEDLKTRLDQIDRGGIVVLGGSLPPGLPDTTYGDLIRWLHARGMRSILDTSGAALASALSARPLLVKPNVQEAQDVLGLELIDDDAIVGAAQEFRRRGAEYAVISYGAGGAIGIGPDGAWKVFPPRVDARSTVGSGDSMVAGMALAFNEGRTFEEGLRLGTAAGAATAMALGTRLCDVEDVQRLKSRVTVRELQLAVTR
jgi:1-phosphofructokinase